MDALELVVDEGRPANAGRFFQLGVDLLALLDELSDLPVAWRVEDLRSASAIARFAPPTADPSEGRWLRLAATSLDAVSGGAGLADDWTPDAIKVARRFVEHAQPTDDDDNWVAPRLVLIEGGQQAGPDVPLTPDLGARLADLQPFERRMPGSIRGMLLGLNVSRGNRASLRVPNGRIVRVGFEMALRADLKEAMFQPVELRGLVRQDDDGRVFHIRAEGVEVLTTPAVRWSDLFGIDPNFTGLADIDDFLEANRGEA